MSIPKSISRISDKKQKLLDELKDKPFEVGEVIYVPLELVNAYATSRDKGKNTNAIILEVHEDTERLIVKRGDGSVVERQYELHFDDVVQRNTIPIGANPFTKDRNSLRFVAYSLDSILFGLNVLGERGEMHDLYEMNGVLVRECNWNPHVYLPDGRKKHYQRGFVWDIQTKQLLIDSIYNDIDLGKVVVRKRGWNELERMAENGETELAFNDIVDGKQRIYTIGEFIKGEFPDSHGNYFGDLSFEAQHRLTGNQLLSYAEMPEESDDKDVIEQFLKLNFAGIPQSREHINFVEGIHGSL